MENRIALWDNLKFFLVTCVVVGHFADQFTDVSIIYDSIFLFIYSFHIPLFIFISGVLYKNKYTISKALFFISIGFVYKIISSLIDRVIYGTVNVEFSLFSDGGISWFMFALAAYIIILKVIENQNKVYILVSTIVLACFVGYDQTIGDYLYLSRIIVFFPFFLSGVILKNVDFVKLRNNNPRYLILGIVILIVWLLLCFFELNLFYRFRYLFTGRNPFFSQIMSYGPLARLITYIISYGVGFSIIMLMPYKKIRLLTGMGKNSINVYFWHMHIYYIIDKFFSLSNLYYLGIKGKLLFLILAVFLSVVLSQDIFNFPIKQIKKQVYKLNSSSK